MAYLDFCVALRKAGTFSSSPRAEFLSFDFRYDVYPKAAVSDKKERANPRMDVRCRRAQRPFPLPTELGQNKSPMKRCPASVFPCQVLHVAKHQPVLVVHVPTKLRGERCCFGGWLVVLQAWCLQRPSLSSLWRWSREEIWLGVSNVKPLILCQRNISLWVWSGNCHLVSLVAALLGAAGAALVPVASTVQGSPKTWG